MRRAARPSKENRMESRAKLLGHPVHQMLVPVPAGLFMVGALLDIIDIFVDAAWIATVSFWNIALGCIAALVAALFGVIDLTKVPRGTRAKRVGVMHASGNVVALVLFAAAVWMRSGIQQHQTDPLALTLEIVAFALLGVAAWLGGELVDRLGIGVDDGAHVDAPNSLRTKRVGVSRR
jgi:uncharacterized membrane protein